MTLQDRLRQERDAVDWFILNPDHCHGYRQLQTLLECSRLMAEAADELDRLAAPINGGGR